MTTSSSPSFDLDKFSIFPESTLIVGNRYTDARSQGNWTRPCKIFSSWYAALRWERPLHPATASYRLLPTIDIISPIIGDDAEKFVNCFPHGVAEVKVRSNGVKYAQVVNPRLDTVSREVLRHDEFKDKVKLGRVRDHFICTPNNTFLFC